MKFRRTFKVETVQNMGSDEMIARAARVSTGKDLLEQDKIEGLIDHQQAAVRAIAAALHGDACPDDPDPGESCGCGDYKREATTALTAATPHLRAAWEQPIRGLCEAAIKRANDPLAARGFYGEAFPATVYAQDILATLNARNTPHRLPKGRLSRCMR